MKYLIIILISTLIYLSENTYAKEIAITIDDPQVLAPLHLNQDILDALKSKNLNAALFVCGKRVDSEDGRELLKKWDQSGHLIMNHSYSHLNYNSSTIDFEKYSQDFIENDLLIRSYKNFTRRYRFPYLKEGDSFEKRNRFRVILRKSGYRQGYVTVDASDWYIDGRMAARLKSNPNVDLSGYRDYYLAHILDRAKYYDDLSRKVLGRSVKHTLLIHHNQLNAFFLKDLLSHLERNGWKIIPAGEAFSDPVFEEEPNIVPAGEGILWGLAKAAGKYNDILRYPAEDGQYEKDAMDRLGL